MTSRWARFRTPTLFLSLFLLLLIVPLIALAEPPAPTGSKIESRILEQLAQKDETTFWIILDEQADLSAAREIEDWNARGAYVVDQLRLVADRSQAPLRDLLESNGVAYRPFWIVNAIRVTGNRAILNQLAARVEVTRVLADGGYHIPEPLPGNEQPRIHATEWGLDRINAPQAWDTFGTRGEGIIVANIDTGVEYNHPALVRQYRGNVGGGNFDHNYNWFDPSRVCGNPSLVPCDNNAHGTHTMGTMIGDDGDPGPNQVGVAPRARWIAAKGCEDFWCSFEALLASGEWILAPTDLNGQNPRPDLRPHAVNNSWGGGPGDTFYQATVQAWVAAGIFPAFSIGNPGDFCGGASSPGDYPESYGVGAFDVNNSIAWFSGRGPSLFGEVKPDISAPGVDVRSSVPGGGYDWFSGTSMAAPHVAGTVALVWSAAPALVGDITATRVLLDQTAIDVSDLACGGDPGNNNVWGEGRLDALAAVDQAPRGPTGTLAGRVTDAQGNPIAGASVQAQGPSNRSAFTNSDGNYSLLLPAGLYNVTVSSFGYLTQREARVRIRQDATTTRDYTLQPAPSHPVSGYVRDTAGNAIPNATVSILGTPIPVATTDANGFYQFASVPEATYEVMAQGGRCYDPQTQTLVVDGQETLDFSLQRRTDGYGYFCAIGPGEFVRGDTRLALSGYGSATRVDLPFRFNFYGRDYNQAYISSSGFLNFLALDGNPYNVPIPNSAPPNAAIYPFWDDLYMDGQSSAWTRVLGEAPNRRFVIEWRNIALSDARVTFEVILYENGWILMQYLNIDANGLEQGNSATIGIENETGTIAFEYSANEPTLSNGLAILYRLPPSGFVEGVVLDAVDRLPVVGATVTARPGGRTVATGPDGRYRLLLPVGTYRVAASANNYEAQAATVQVQVDQTARRPFMLRSARAQVDAPLMEFTAMGRQSRTALLRLSNVGAAPLSYTIGEVPVVSGTNAGRVVSMPEGSNSRVAPAGYTTTTVPPRINGGPVLVFMDALPWGSDGLLQVIAANGLSYDVASSAQMSNLDLSGYEVVFISSDQPQGFYNAFNANLARFDAYVQGGGFLWVSGAAWGWNGGDFNGAQLPGGATISGPVWEEANDIVDNGHPIVQGMPDPFFGSAASHAAFENLPAGATVIARGQGSNQPVLIEYEHEAGRVLALGQPLEAGWMWGWDLARILENGVPYAYAFEPVLDIPWLSVAPAAGAVAPGETQEIQVTVNARGLTPGLYRARLSISTNDPRNPRMQVPVTLIVPAYQQGVDAGGSSYIDLQGDRWAADRAYRAGSWGYTRMQSSVETTEADIGGTLDDPLYQTLRRGAAEYRFDGLPAGVYQVDLLFAALSVQRAQDRIFDVIMEDTLVLPRHDVLRAVGLRQADRRTFFVPVRDGQLNIRFVGMSGYNTPTINAIKVTHRPDR